MFHFLSFLATFLGWLVLLYLFVSSLFSITAWAWYWKVQKHEAEEKGIPRWCYAQTVGFKNLWRWILECLIYLLIKDYAEKRLREAGDITEVAQELGISPREVTDRVARPLSSEYDITEIFSVWY